MEYRKEIQSTGELAAWYDRKYTEMGDGWATPEEECHRHLDDLGVPFDKNRTLLDVGCGAGHFLVEAQKRVDAEGIEISSSAIQYAYKRHAIPGSIGCVSIELLGMDTFHGRLYDYITCMGSLEHVVDIDTALDNIESMLKPDGKAYFLVPNDKWPHQDQPNERTYPAQQWVALFKKHGLDVHRVKAWGPHQDAYTCTHMERASKAFDSKQYTRINAGSGQRPFDPKYGWCNIDIQNKYSPDLVADWNDLSMFEDNSIEYVVSHHSLEHVGCGEGNQFLRESYRILRPGGSLLVFVPDMRALAERWLTKQIDDYTYFVNIYGAYMGDESDRHKFAYSYNSMRSDMLSCASWTRIIPFNWRDISGSSLARDWWIMAIEAVK